VLKRKIASLQNLSNVAGPDRKMFQHNNTRDGLQANSNGTLAMKPSKK
jgi:hypothetical protein